MNSRNSHIGLTLKEKTLYMVSCPMSIAPAPWYGPLAASPRLSKVSTVTEMVGVEVTILVTVLVFEVS